MDTRRNETWYVPMDGVQPFCQQFYKLLLILRFAGVDGDERYHWLSFFDRDHVLNSSS
jgi:hypothetical protein